MPTQKHISSVAVNCKGTGASTKSNELGMRPVSACTRVRAQERIE